MYNITLISLSNANGISHSVIKLKTCINDFFIVLRHAQQYFSYDGGQFLLVKERA
jgi:hypothetical protein